MKREIKFKAKRLDGKGWVEGSLIRSTTGIKERAYIVDNFSSMSDYSVIGVDPSTVCQFTGLKDCEGKEVWEGDILQDVDYYYIKYVVIFGEGTFLARKEGHYTGIPLHECIGDSGNVTYAKLDYYWFNILYYTNVYFKTYMGR